MTTPTVTGKATSAKTDAAAQAPAAAVAQSAALPINRREFLFYIWGASLAMYMATFGGAMIWFALPRFREGEFGGIFTVDPGSIPAAGAAPVRNSAGRFWMAQTDSGFVAISAVCTHLGCLFDWNTANGRFECPCHGSKFTLGGKYIEGPAPRNLDQFAVSVVGAAGETPADGLSPISIAGATQVKVNTGRKLKGGAPGQA
jgi:cytochrome b6-f complex iron-sulfur subunit